MIISNEEKHEIQVSAILDAYSYLDIQHTDLLGMTLNEIIIEIKNNTQKYNYSTEDQKPYYDVIERAIESNPEIGEYILISQSTVDGNIPYGELVAVAFKAPDNEEDTNRSIYVAYRGTGDGKWVDNGQAMYQESSLMQRRAGEYFDYVVDSQELGARDRIIVTGHSKGGNLAQYATMATDNSLLVDACYSFDGQGFSAKGIEHFKNSLKDNYQTQIDKMYSINGENDYMHTTYKRVFAWGENCFTSCGDKKRVKGKGQS